MHEFRNFSRAQLSDFQKIQMWPARSLWIKFYISSWIYSARYIRLDLSTSDISGWIYPAGYKVGSVFVFQDSGRPRSQNRNLYYSLSMRAVWSLIRTLLWPLLNWRRLEAPCLPFGQSQRRLGGFLGVLGSLRQQPERVCNILKSSGDVRRSLGAV